MTYHKWYFLLITPILALNLLQPPSKTASFGSKLTEAAFLPLTPYNSPSIGLSDVLIHRLISCESGGKVDAKGDSGRAFGILQFWQSTFYLWGKKYEILPKDIEYQETLNLINDPILQISLAKNMIENESGALGHWYNCSKKMHLI